MDTDWSSQPATALTYENLCKAVNAMKIATERPLTVQEFGSHIAVDTCQDIEQGKITCSMGCFNLNTGAPILHVRCHPADLMEAQAAVLGALFQAHRERYGNYGEEA